MAKKTPSRPTRTRSSGPTRTSRSRRRPEAAAPEPRLEIASSREGANYAFRIDPATGLAAVTFLAGGEFRALDASAVVRSSTLGTRTIRLSTQQPAVRTLEGPGSGDIRVESTSGSALRFSVTYGFSPDGFRLRCRLENRGSDPVRVHEVRPLDVPGRDQGWRLPGGTLAWRAYKHGWCTSSPGMAVPMEGGEEPLRLRFPPASLMPGFLTRMLYNEGEDESRPRGSIRSEWVLGLEGTPGAQSVTIGFIGLRKHFSPIRIDLTERSLQAVAQMDDVPLEPGQSFETEDLWVGFGRSGRAGLERWAQIVGETASGNKPRRTIPKPFVLWCSWYSGLYGSVDERSFLANLSGFRQAWKGDAFFQLDDGYESAIGDWLTCNRKFPGGLETLARRVRSEGFKPGIWLAPFCAEKRSRVFQEHPEWIVKGEDGKPRPTGFIPGPKALPRLTYSLDTTRPDVLEHIRRTVETLAGWGFELFKVDFLTAGAAAGVRQDPGATRAEAYARGMEALRAGAADRPLMGAIAPLIASAGWLDIQRVGPDVSFGRPAWVKRWQEWANDRMSPGVRNNLLGTFGRYFLDGRLWASDPDAMVGEGLTTDEQRTLVTADLLLGGVVMIGHDFSREELDLSPIREILAFSRERVDFEDLFQPDAGMESPRMVRVESRKDGASYLLTALFNLGSRTQARRLTLPAGLHAEGGDLLDFWEPDAGPWRLGAAVPIPPRGCRLFAIRLASPPAGSPPANET